MLFYILSQLIKLKGPPIKIDRRNLHFNNLFRISYVPDSIFGREVGYANFFCGLPQSLQSNARILCQIKLRTLPFPSSQFIAY
jgi:hypothetical protein